MNDRMARLPEDFDWVSARNSYSLVKVFEKLRIQIEEDVKARNTLRREQRWYVFSVVSAGNNAFSVVVEGNCIHDSIRFTLGEGKISVWAKEGLLFEATVTLCNDGECRAKINGQEYDLWQMRRTALEELFFRQY